MMSGRSPVLNVRQPAVSPDEPVSLRLPDRVLACDLAMRHGGLRLHVDAGCHG